MSHNPRLPPDSSKATPSWDDKPRDAPSFFFHTGKANKERSNDGQGKNVTQVAQTLAAHGGGAVSVELAFELVLNDLVGQAKEATGANGAAIALMRDGSLVCRATTGENAPDLGVRVEASSLAGECLNTGSVQQCRDTDTDTRVNAEACRRLGVRSMLIAPLTDAGQIFGILQVFSAWPNAFGEREISALQSLAQRIAENKREAEASTVLPASGVDEIGVAAESAEQNIAYEKSAVIGDQDQNFAPEAISLPPGEKPRGNELWTSTLIVLVIGAAVLLGVAIGWHSAARGVSGTSQAPKSEPATVSANSKPGINPSPAAGSDATQPANLEGTPNSEGKSTASASSSLSTGGLVVTQNGKVIYRSTPEGSGPNPATSTATNSGTRLIRRVEPEYPQEAREQDIQGTVVLVVTIQSDGTIGEIGVASGDPLLANAAVKAVKQWRYQPYSVNGQPVERQTRISIKFTLPPS
jgi:TonB family protein